MGQSGGLPPGFEGETGGPAGGGEIGLRDEMAAGQGAGGGPPLVPEDAS